MITGTLAFKPLADGSVQILIKGKKEDIPELASLYGCEVEVARQRAVVQRPELVIAQNAMHDLDRVQDGLRELCEALATMPVSEIRKEATDAD